MKTIRFYLSLPWRYQKLKELIEHLQPVGKIGEVQRLFDITYTPQTGTE